MRENLPRMRPGLREDALEAAPWSSRPGPNSGQGFFVFADMLMVSRRPPKPRSEGSIPSARSNSRKILHMRAGS